MEKCKISIFETCGTSGVTWEELTWNKSLIEKIAEIN